MRALLPRTKRSPGSRDKASRPSDRFSDERGQSDNQQEYDQHGADDSEHEEVIASGHVTIDVGVEVSRHGSAG